MKKGTALIRDFTTGPIFWPLVEFSLPFMLSNALQVLYTTVDMWVVGRYLRLEGLTAVTNAGRLVDFLTALCIGLSVSAQIYVAQLIGQGRRGELNRTIGTVFSAIALIAIAMTVLGVVGADALVRAMNVPAEAAAGARTYLVTCTFGLLLSYGYNIVSAVLRGMGDSKRPFVFVAIASVTNLVLDLLFVGRCGMGVFGAAFATVIGQGLSYFIALAYLYRHRAEFGFDFRPSSFRIHGPIFRSFIRLGIPIAVRFSAINISMMYVLRLINGVGAAASAVFGVGVKLDDIVTKVTQGIMQATTGMVGQNYGARRFDRLRRVVVYAWLFSFGFYAVYTCFLLGNPRGMFAFFTDDSAVLDLAPLFAFTIVWSFPGLVIMRGTNGFINGIGNAALALAFGLLDGVVLRIGCSWLLGDVLGMGLRGYILGYAVACYGMGVPALVYFYFGPWERRKAVTA